MDKRIITLIFLLLSGWFTAAGAQISTFSSQSTGLFVPVDQAFIFDFRQQGEKLTLSWQIKPGYYLYRDQIRLTSHNSQMRKLTLPDGKPHHDEFYGKTEVYSGTLTLPVILQQAGEGAVLQVTYQGCAAAGFCYPPETRDIPLTMVESKNANNETAAPLLSDDAPKPGKLPFSPLWAILIGIGIAFTPCVLPMYPLIAGIIAGERQQLSTRRLLLLGMVYVQGMAITYTIMGIIIAAAGLHFQAALQSPRLLISLAVLFVILALSMFGLFQLQLPSGLQTRLAQWSNHQQGGSLTGVLSMGALAGLICSPCTTAPLSAILLYIAQSGNMVAGAGTLYLYALGMGLPLIAVVVFGHKILPKRGPWMQTVKEGFGFVILAFPVFLAERLVGDPWSDRLWSLLAVSFFGWALFNSLRLIHRRWMVLQIMLLIATVISARPLQEWVFNPAPGLKTSSLSFKRVDNLSQLERFLQTSDQKITMLDLYADWCVACKQFEKYTFSDPAVQSQLGSYQRLQADVTDNSDENSALLRKLQIVGLPVILFFDQQGKEIPHSRVTGFMNAEQFRLHLQQLEP